MSSEEGHELKVFELKVKPPAAPQWMQDAVSATPKDHFPDVTLEGLKDMRRKVEAELVALNRELRARKDPQEWSEEEKQELRRELFVALATMPPEKRGKVVEIINSGPSPLATNDDGELELNMDGLDIDTLRKVDAYVQEEAQQQPQANGDSSCKRTLHFG